LRIVAVNTIGHAMEIVPMRACGYGNDVHELAVLK
jgi:hypothetical protein